MKFTKEAVEQFKIMAENEKKEGMRVFLYKSCCSEMIMFEPGKGQPNDIKMTQDGLEMYIDPALEAEQPSAEIGCENGQFTLKGIKSKGSSCCGHGHD